MLLTIHVSDQMDQFNYEIIFSLTFLGGVLAISCLSTDFISRGPGILFLHDFSGTFHGAVVQTLVLSQAKFVDKIFVTRFISY